MGSIGKRLRRVSHRTQTQLGDTTSRLTENLAGSRLIKAFRLENYAIGRLNENFEAVFQLRMKSVRTRARAAPALEALAGLAVAGIVGFAYWRIANGVSTVGDFMGFVAALLHGGTAAALDRQQHDRDHGGPGRGRPHVRAARREADHRRPSRRQAACDFVRQRRVRPRRVLLQLGSRIDGGHRLLADRARRQDGGSGGPLRRRQVDRHQSGGAPVRRRLRPHPDRWPGCAGRDGGKPARCHCHRQPGSDAVRRHASAPTSRSGASAPARPTSWRPPRQPPRTTSSWPSRRATTR